MAVALRTEGVTSTFAPQTVVSIWPSQLKTFFHSTKIPYKKSKYPEVPRMEATWRGQQIFSPHYPFLSSHVPAYQLMVSGEIPIQDLKGTFHIHKSIDILSIEKWNLMDAMSFITCIWPGHYLTDTSTNSQICECRQMILLCCQDLPSHRSFLSEVPDMGQT